MCARVTVITAAMIALSSLAAASPINLGDSGWSVQWTGAVTGVSLVEVSHAQSYVKISVAKLFGPDDPDDYDIHGLLTFRATASDHVNKVIITSEQITNNSGLNWTGYKWLIFEIAYASFDPTAADTNTWDASPFTSLNLNSATEILTASGGTVSNGSVFSPTGELVIHAPNVGSNDTFNLKQSIIPEPLSLVLFALGGVFIARRRVK